MPYTKDSLYIFLYCTCQDAASRCHLPLAIRLTAGSEVKIFLYDFAF